MTRIANSVLEERRQRALEAYAAASDAVTEHDAKNKDVYVAFLLDMMVLN